MAILHAFHQKLQQSTRGGIKHFHGEADPAIANYAERFQSSLPREFKRSSPKKLIEQINLSDIVLFGDFHTLAESQLSFFEVLKMSYDANGARPITVALEIFSATDQMHIDEYLNGTLPEEYFLKRIDYHNKWGFPWENYRPIIDFCARHKLPIVGINRQSDSKDRLAKRDAFAAQILESCHEKEERSLVLCLIGEYHLADGHLPEQLKQKKILRIVNNVDEYSFSTMGGPLSPFDTIELNPRFFCVLSTSPWLKWQSLAMWEEIHGVGEDSFYGGHPDPDMGESYDFEYQLLFVLKSLNEFLGLGLNASDLSFDIYFKPDRATFSHLRSKFTLSRSTIDAAERKISQDGYCYIPNARAVLVSDFRIQHLLEASGFILAECLIKQKSKPLSIKDRIRMQVIGTLSTLLMNPRQLVYTLNRVEDEWKGLQRKRLLGELRRLREAFKVVRELSESDFSLLKKAGRALETKDIDSNFLVSRITGEVIASEIFSTLLAGDAIEFKKGLKALFESPLESMLEQMSEEPQKLLEAS